MSPRNMSLLNYVPHAPLRLTCLSAIRAFAPSCLRALHALRALIMRLVYSHISAYLKREIYSMFFSFPFHLFNDEAIEFLV